MASMTTSASATPAPSTSALQPRAGRGVLRRVAQALVEQLARAFERRLDVLEARDPASVTVKPRSAHQAAMSPPMTPAPTTCTCLHVRAALAALGLEPILQQEHADQVARGRRWEQARDRARLGLEGARAVRAVARPQVDHGVGRRVVRARRPPGDLGDERAADEGPHAGRGSAAARRSGGRRGAGALQHQLARRGMRSSRFRHQPVDAARAAAAFSARTGLPVSISCMAGRTPIRRTRAHRAAESRMNAQLHLRQPELTAAHRRRATR